MERPRSNAPPQRHSRSQQLPAEQQRLPLNQKSTGEPEENVREIREMGLRQRNNTQTLSMGVDTKRSTEFTLNTTGRSSPRPKSPTLLSNYQQSQGNLLPASDQRSVERSHSVSQGHLKDAGAPVSHVASIQFPGSSVYSSHHKPLSSQQKPLYSSADSSQGKTSRMPRQFVQESNHSSRHTGYTDQRSLAPSVDKVQARVPCKRTSHLWQSLCYMIQYCACTDFCLKECCASRQYQCYQYSAQLVATSSQHCFHPSAEACQVRTSLHVHVSENDRICDKAMQSC